ncbi:MAG: hypothetical protein F6K35_42655 [Okeania sp. SIO2H7]|nr:hypothetical protein [Okeania sp. SIO2H7]
MNEFIVIVESSADARTATKLAERVLANKIDWLEPEMLQHLFVWSGLEENTEHSCWKDIKSIIERAKESDIRIPKFLGGRKNGATKADGAATRKILNLVSSLQKKRQIKGVIFIRDLDNQPERKEGIEGARSEYSDRQPQLAIVIGTANRMREAWVLNGFVTANKLEKQTLEEIKTKLTFDPCEESHRLHSKKEEAERLKNAKVVLQKLTDGDFERERICWEETSLELLKTRGVSTGLTDYLNEIEERLVPIIRRDR